MLQKFAIIKIACVLVQVGQGVEYRRFPHIGVAHQSHGGTAAVCLRHLSLPSLSCRRPAGGVTASVCPGR